MLRTAQSLPLEGLSTLGFDPTRFQTEPPACYRASRQLPGPDSHRQATTSLRLQLSYTLTSRLAGRTNQPGYDDGYRSGAPDACHHGRVGREVERAHTGQQGLQRGVEPGRITPVLSWPSIDVVRHAV
jgi:hypothetical protein